MPVRRRDIALDGRLAIAVDGPTFDSDDDLTPREWGVLRVDAWRMWAEHVALGREPYPPYGARRYDGLRGRALNVIYPGNAEDTVRALVAEARAELVALLPHVRAVVPVEYDNAVDRREAVLYGNLGDPQWQRKLPA